jgi:hypothetical protein
MLKKENFNNGDHPTADEICEHLAILRGSWKYLDHSRLWRQQLRKNRELRQYQRIDKSPAQLYDLATESGEAKTYSTKNPN